MGDLFNEIQRDVERYEEACVFFGVDPVLNEGIPDPYCEHALQLIDQWRAVKQRHVQRDPDGWREKND